ncbi:MAG TPA: CHAT domain-containing tetratricopeptide repeat protein [Thermoanaerobaculia bacterium]|nr:CHAT domain-containing tetratricopeptide repeat protein [Thermoanaerobaculia bacterium]
MAGQEELTLFDARGRQLLHVDSLTASGSPPQGEEIHWVAEAPGELRVEQKLPAGSRGPCDLRLAEKRHATAADRERAKAEAELARGHAQRRTRKPEQCREGIAPYESAERRFAGLGLPRRRAEALLGLGLLHKECLKENEAALRAFSRAEPLFVGDPPFESTVRQHLGELRFALGDLDGALGEYRRALTLRQQLGNRADEALTFDTLGRALQELGRYDEAAAHFDRAIALWPPGGDPGKKAKILLNRGHLHRDLGETERARERFREALGLFRRAKDRDSEAVALNALGLLALDEGKPAAALQPLGEALKLRAPGTRSRAVTLTALGLAWRGLGRTEDARQAYLEALAIFRSAGDLREQASSLGNLGRLEDVARQDAAALDYFDQALGLLRKLANPLETARILEGKARVLRRRGDLEAARGLLEESLAEIEGYRLRQTSYDTRAAFFATRQGFYDSLIDLLMEMHRKAPAEGYAAAALAVSERSLARSLLDGLAASGADLRRGGTDPGFRAREREIENEIDVLVSRQTFLAQKVQETEDAGAAALLRKVEADLRSRWDELDRVRSALRVSDPRYAALTQPQPASAETIRRALLDHDTLLLEYRLGDEKSFLWAVTPDSLQSFELPGRAVIEEPARRVFDLLSHPWNPKTEAAARRRLAELRRLLLDPVAPLLPGKRLLIVGGGILQSVPFAALPDPAGGAPLIAGHEIVSLPSVSVLGELRREAAGRPRAPKTLWVLADPDFGKVFTDLPKTGDEARAILALVPASERFEVLGREATRAAVLQGNLRDYRFLHFATHGSFGATEPGGGRLVLSQTGPNGFLHLADIYELDLRADLVVLSACRSALGQEVRGEGMMGMTRGFFYAGAERVLVSLWNVPDRVTAELMQRFYRGMLKEGLSPPAALRAAQNEIRRRWRSPYYWAAFTLQGEWRGEDL